MQGGKLYFFTATNLEWKMVLWNDHYKMIVVNSLRYLIFKNEVIVYAFVIMPNHMHIIWSFPEFSDPSKIKQRFMKYTAQVIIEDLKRNRNSLLYDLKVDAADRMYQVWERNPLAVELFTESIMWQKLEYIHNNPCNNRWRLTTYPENYRFSSASFYILNKSEWDFITHIKEA
ncbi:MAG: transposase [Chitinophagales bacterium]|nr:transposase [Chitinophagales bacterium]